MLRNVFCFLTLVLLGGVTAAQHGRSQSSSPAAPPKKIAASQAVCDAMVLGDVNGDGVVTDADAQMILDWLAGKVPALTCPANADANQDGVITEADAQVIKERVRGRSRILTVNLEGGLPGEIYTGGIVEIGAKEAFFPFYVKSGTARIQSPSTGYDSGDQTMVFQTDGRSLYWHWQTGGLPEASDYLISVSMNQPGPLPALTGADAVPLTHTASLEVRPYQPVQLSRSVDAAAPTTGIPLAFTRSWAHDSYSTPALGPFALGWKHNFDIQLHEFTDGTVAFVGPGGVDRVFTPNSGGAYAASPGDHGALLVSNGLFQLREKNGLVYSFGQNLLLSFIVDRNGNSITCGYDDQGRLVSLQHSSGAAFALQYNTLGFISMLTDQTGRRTLYTYDISGTHLASVTASDGRVTSYSYTRGLGVAVDDRIQVIAFPDQTHLYISYDAMGRIASTHLDGNASRFLYSYPGHGQTTITDADHGMTSILVSENLQPVQFTDPLGSVTKYQYDSSFNLISSTDPLGRTRTYSYDNQGNVIQAVDQAGNRISMAYDPIFSRLTTFKDSRGNKTTFVLDGNGNVTSEIYPNGTSQSYTYDHFGLPSSSTDRKGQTKLYSYAPSGQLQSVTYPDQTVASYAYDPEGNLISATDSTGTISMSYDAGNRLLSKTYPGNRSLQYKYDSGGRRIQLTDADGQNTDYTYDKSGRLSELVDSTGHAIVSYQYDALGRVSEKILANGIRTRYSYDPASRVERITNSGRGGKAISFFGYTYDAAGDVLSKISIEGLEQYTYDSLGQLTGVSYPNGTAAQYSYDSAGNRVSASESGVQSSYVTNSQNQYESVGPVSYAYDANGNMSGQSPSQPQVPYIYSYDFNNRLTGAQSPSETVSYTYNALGERSSRTDQSGSVQYLWDGLEVATEQSPSSQTTARYTWGRSLDEAVAMARNGASYYYTQDALRSVSDVLTSSGAIAEHYTYSAFGTPNQSSGVGNPFLFTGARYDQASSLYSLRARWYSPGIGRFITQDPIGVLGGSNMYAYAVNSPATYSDRLGLFPEDGPQDMHLPDPADPPHFDEPLEPPVPQIPVVTPFPLIYTLFVDQLFQQTFDGTGITTPFFEGITIEIDLDIDRETDLDGDTGGECPTFIQLGHQSEATPAKPLDQSLFGKISPPIDNALLRSDIPIYGVAGGTDFKEYRVEYGEGTNPSRWNLIQSSTTPQPTNKAGLRDIQFMQGDMDLRGNLATWNTGLKEWVHLPWHPASDPTDLRGEYTLRLLVTGKDGRTTEDRVKVEVGRVISQVLPGDAISTDNRVTMHFEAQSLQAPFRVYTIKPLVNNVPPVPAGMAMAGSPYTIREPGDQFMKPVVLSFNLTGETAGRDMAEFGIYAYDVKTRQWSPMPTFYGSQPNTVETSIYMLPEPVAYFAVLCGGGSQSAPKRATASSKLRSAAENSDPLLVSNNFETSLGEWAARDRAFGATVTRDQSATPDGSYSLKITNLNAGGDFAVTAVSTPFRADMYPLVSFDYRIGPGVKTDFYVRMGQTWYRVGFSGAEDDGKFRNADVGISPIGRIDGILTDGQWHSASFDLNRLLANKTARRNVDEMIMADWRVGGYMKLEFGDNQRGASFNIDNFKIRRGEDMAGAGENNLEPLLIDDFKGTSGFNRLGGASDVFSNPGTQNVEMARVLADDSSRGRQTLSLKYDVTRPGSYGGYWTQLRGTPGENFDQVTLRVKTTSESSGFLVGLKRKDGVEPKVPAERYWGPSGPNGWRTVAIPLAAFGAPKELSGLDLLSISFANASRHGKGELLIDDLRLERGLTSVLIADFEEDPGTNCLMQKNWIFTHGAAALAVAPQKPESEPGSQSLRISYGGTIGADLGRGDFSYAGWVAGLGGIDASHAQMLRFRIRGQAGGERFNIYLDDGNMRRPVDTADYVTITKDWQEVTVPLEVLARQGVDLSHLQELQFVFEWRQMSGTVYVDDIRLTGTGAKIRPVAFP